MQARGQNSSDFLRWDVRKNKHQKREYRLKSRLGAERV